MGHGGESKIRVDLLRIRAISAHAISKPVASSSQSQQGKVPYSRRQLLLDLLLLKLSECSGLSETGAVIK